MSQKEEKCKELEEKAINYRVEMMGTMVDAMPNVEKMTELLEAIDLTSNEAEKSQLRKELNTTITEMSKTELKMLKMRDDIIPQLPDFQSCGIPFDYFNQDLRISKNKNGEEVWVRTPRRTEEE